MDRRWRGDPGETGALARTWPRRRQEHPTRKAGLSKRATASDAGWRGRCRIPHPPCILRPPPSWDPPPPSSSEEEHPSSNVDGYMHRGSRVEKDIAHQARLRRQSLECRPGQLPIHASGHVGARDPIRGVENEKEPQPFRPLGFEPKLQSGCEGGRTRIKSNTNPPRIEPTPSCPV